MRRRAATLLRESEYLLKATAITYTQWENGEVVLFVFHSLLFFLLRQVVSGMVFLDCFFFYWNTSSAEDFIFICKGVFFMYYHSYSSKEHIVTRNNAHLYLASETRIPAHVRKIATEAFERRSIIEKVPASEPALQHRIARFPRLRLFTGYLYPCTGIRAWLRCLFWLRCPHQSTDCKLGFVHPAGNVSGGSSAPISPFSSAKSGTENPEARIF